MKSIFTEKTKTPTQTDVENALGKTFGVWQHFETFTKNRYPDAVLQWHFTSEKLGWSLRIKDKKRVIVYLLPREHFFKVALVFGQKATDAILKSAIPDTIKNEIETAKVYAEGRGIRIDITNESLIGAIEKLIEIKIDN